MKRVVSIVPARMGSSRFPGKPLAKLLGRSMIEHVYRRTELCRSLDAVYVATCDEEIRREVESFGGRAVMTSPRHERASERVAEAVERIDAEIVVMVQGDEPMTRPEMIDSAIEPLREDPAVECVNLIRRIESAAQLEDPNTIKVVKDLHGDALYFSRQPIPSRVPEAGGEATFFKQVCIIPFRRGLLLRYAQLPPTPLEKAEAIDMLRLLEHGHRVRLREIEEETQAVDTPADLALVEALMAKDPLLESYLGIEGR